MPRHEPGRSWTHEEIWGLIRNNGVNADPADVPMRVFDPLHGPDFFEQGIK